MNNASGVLMVFVKNPEPGKVKTRLAEKIGNHEAARIYEKLLSITERAVAPLYCDKKIYYQDFIGAGDLWKKKGYVQVLQPEGGLGEKMASVFRENLRTYDKAVIIGSDCPGISSDHLEEAFAHLNDHDVVIGPALDGGYYLLGLNHFEPSLFSNKSWSTEKVFEETVTTLKNKGYSYHLLPVLNDIDTLEDLKNSSLSDQFSQEDGA